MNNQISLVKSITEYNELIEKCKELIDKYLIEIINTEESIKKLKESQVTHTKKIKICELLLDLKEIYIDHFMKVASNYEISKQSFLGKSLM